ncbi:MAG: RNA polymerase factor sigma-54 [Firmicutes bacterium]|nr:RNA polymerase factor sigma-54 [Bacillota bacterium]
MRMTYSMKLEQTQKLIMTPKLQQAISLLQLPIMELQVFLQNEYLNNPILDFEEETEKEVAGEEIQPDAGQEKDPIDWDEYLRDEVADPLPAVNVRSTDALSAIDYALPTEPSLQEHLLFQLGLCSVTSTQKYIGQFLIGNIDPNGYVNGEMDELALLLGVEEREILAVLEIIQTFDPIGVGARSLLECLLLQLGQCQDNQPLAQTIIRHHLADVADNKVKKIATHLHVHPHEVQCAIDYIRTLDPKPGSLIGGSSDVLYIVPDVVVEKVQNEYIVLVNESNLPRLTINPYYRSLLGKGKSETQASDFIKSRLDSALWLVRSIEQRRTTLYHVAENIVRRQRDFLEEGVRHLVPMTLRQIAEEIGVHESTVSRTTANKYIQTPRGVYSLKFFFTSGVEDDHGTAVSSESVKSHLKELIAAESQYRPYSDQKLSELLVKRGIIVSRRTIAKYREELTIPASSRRRRL